MIFRVMYFLFAALLCMQSHAADPAPKTKPLFRDFIGINGHTVQFKPELYSQVCKVVRDYHPLEWDTGNETDYKLDFPSARNGVNWETVYGAWRKNGFFNDACIMFETVPADQWKSLAKDSFHYGERFATNFGPSSHLKLVDAVEIGNEPGKFTDEQYRIVFENMSKGFRQGDQKLKIATCNVNVSKSGDYHKSVDCLNGLQDFYDVLNIHSYALIEGWPTWKRSYPENPKLLTYTQDVDNLIAWRDGHVPDKEIWLTEFGWDSSTQPNHPEGDFAKWVGNNDLEQAQWLVRSFFLFAKRDVQKAFVFFFNDDDSPQFHGSSGLTRKFQPKPSFFAVSHLFRTLGDYRLNRVIRESQELGFLYEFAHELDASRFVLVAWLPSGTQAKSQSQLDLAGHTLSKVERMPVSSEPAPLEDLTVTDQTVGFTVDENPLYFFLTR